MKKALLYIAGAITMIWGIAHLFGTSGVLKGFGDTSPDNKLIISMEWIVEGLTLIFLGLLTIIVTRTDTASKLSRNVLVAISAMLISMAVLSLFTGFGVNFLPFKLCPVIFSLSALLIMIAMILKPKQN
jgi:hypothetical protein